MIKKLNECRFGEIKQVKPGRIFLARTEKNLPTVLNRKTCKEILLVETQKVKLISINTDQRVLGYIFHLRGQPRIRLGWNYLFAFYGRKISSIKILHRNSTIRLISGGNGKLVGLVVRSKEDEIEESPSENL
jgi:hypothetical protein